MGSYNRPVKDVGSDASLVAGTLLRFVVVGVLTWAMAVAVDHGGVWYLLFIPFVPLALFQLGMGSAILWSWSHERRLRGD
jgi:hypothetical protein